MFGLWCPNVAVASMAAWGSVVAWASMSARLRGATGRPAWPHGAEGWKGGARQVWGSRVEGEHMGWHEPAAIAWVECGHAEECAGWSGGGSLLGGDSAARAGWCVANEELGNMGNRGLDFRVYLN